MVKTVGHLADTDFEIKPGYKIFTYKFRSVKMYRQIVYMGYTQLKLQDGFLLLARDGHRFCQRKIFLRTNANFREWCCHLEKNEQRTNDVSNQRNKKRSFIKNVRKNERYKIFRTILEKKIVFLLNEWLFKTNFLLKRRFFKQTFENYYRFLLNERFYWSNNFTELTILLNDR